MKPHPKQEAREGRAVESSNRRNISCGDDCALVTGITFRAWREKAGKGKNGAEGQSRTWDRRRESGRGCYDYDYLRCLFSIAANEGMV